MTDEETTQFLPFHAINEFMRDDYRLEVVRSALAALPTLPDKTREQLDLLTRRLVQVPGFRNSAKAPASKRVRPTAEAFTKSPFMVAAVLSAWAQVHVELRQQVYDLLVEREWEILPADADRSQLPGFFPYWPSDDDFDTLAAAFKQKYPDATAGADDISLMIVWLSASLPYDHDHDHDHDEDDDEDLGEEA